MPTRKVEVQRANNLRQRQKLLEVARSINSSHIALHAQRCPDCGARVLLPCRACGVESAKRAGAAREADHEPEDACEYLPTADELVARMAEVRARHLAYKLAQPYAPHEIREGNLRELSLLGEREYVDDETH